MTDATLAQVAGLPDLATAELKRLWRELYGKDAPPYNRPYLVKRLAYRLQELRHGGLPESARFQMRVILQDIGADNLASPRPAGGKAPSRRKGDSPPAGTRLIRDWQAADTRSPLSPTDTSTAAGATGRSRLSRAPSPARSGIDRPSSA